MVLADKDKVKIRRQKYKGKSLKKNQNKFILAPVFDFLLESGNYT